MKIGKLFFLVVMITLSFSFLLSCSPSGTKNTSAHPDLSQGGSSETGKEEPKKTESKSLLYDPYYQNGFSVKALGGKDGVAVAGYFPEGCNEIGNRVFWNIGQWAARYSLVDKTVSKQTVLGDKIYQVQSPTEKFIADMNTGQLTFHCTTSRCYDKPRTGSEGWLHLLIESNLITNDDWNKVTELEQLNVSMDTKLTKFEDHMGDAFNPSVHAAQFLMYVVAQNKNPESPDYSKYIWMGIGMFDNRNEAINGGAMWDNGTGAMMYGLPSSETLVGDYHYFKDGKIQAGEDTPWVSYKVDLLKHVEVALKITQYRGHLRDTVMDDLYFTGMNLGWELPGTYDVEMLLKNLNITAVRNVKE